MLSAVSTIEEKNVPALSFNTKVHRPPRCVYGSIASSSGIDEYAATMSNG
jgi:hypothetical protein